ncbi:MAG: hypothetical protein JO354_08000 [Verrucomicrobia bacterium]|nr:hypothetical protein [Verrucomicrobiota bacterium]
MRRVILRAGLIFATTVLATLAGADDQPPLTWADEISKGFVPYHQLTADDFRIDDKARLNGDYEVKTFIDPPQYRIAEKISDDGVFHVYVTDWTIFSGLDRNGTARRSKVRYIKGELPYAQALFDLTELRARELAALTAAQLPSADGNTLEEARGSLQKQTDKLYQDKLQQARDETAEFQKATDGGRNKRKVRELGPKIRKRLDALPPVPTPAPTPTPTATATATPTPASR